jgi:hypothetical protein
LKGRLTWDLIFEERVLRGESSVSAEKSSNDISINVRSKIGWKKFRVPE